MKYLVDVNFLIAAIWSNHQNHAKADAWLKGKSLAACPMSELGFLRISTHPRALNSDMAGARTLLEDFLKRHAVEFVPCDLPGLQSRAGKSDQVTDLYLADLAASKSMKLVSLDAGIAHAAAEIIK